MSDGDQRITIAICTLDRTESLRRTLESLCEQSSLDFELAVVDNSPAQTAERVFDAVAHRYPGGARYQVVEQLGLSAARNAALERSRARFVAFLDDDVTLPHDWFVALAEGLAKPDTVAAGGPIRIVWEGGRPRWMRPEHETFYSALDLGPAERVLHPPWESPFGANFAVARDAALEVGAFDTELGRVGSRLIGGEEIDLMVRIASRGSVRYLPSAWVNHHVEAVRATRRWLFRRYFAQGGTSAHMPQPVGDSPAPPAGAGAPLGMLPYRLASRLGRELARPRRPRLDQAEA